MTAADFCDWCGNYFPHGQVCDKCRRRMLPPMAAAWIAGLAAGMVAGVLARRRRL